jgi:hypothetical protein
MDSKLAKRAFAMGLILSLWTTCFLAQKPAWKTDHRDSLLVPPGARNVTFKAAAVTRWDGPGENDELTYTLDEPFPAKEFLDHLCNDLQLKGWSPLSRPDPNHWIRIPADAYARYQSRDGFTWMTEWQNNANQSVTYWLNYKMSADPNHLRILYVKADFSAGPPPPPPKPPPVYANSGTPVKTRIMAGGLLILYVLVLVGIYFLFARLNAGSAVFYGGPNAWLTWMNLALFAPFVPAFLAVGEILLSLAIPMAQKVAGLFSGGGMLTLLMLILFSKVGYAACAIVLLFMVSILFAKRIPRRVKIAHLVLGLLSLSYFVVSIVVGLELSKPFLQL